MGDGHGATGTRRQRLMLVGLLVGLLMTSAAPEHAQRGGQGGHGFRSSPHGGFHGGPQPMALQQPARRPWRAPQPAHGPWLRRAKRRGACLAVLEPLLGPVCAPPRIVAPPPECMSNLPHTPGTTVRIPQGTTRMCTSAPAAGDRLLHRPKSLHTSVYGLSRDPCQVLVSDPNGET